MADIDDISLKTTPVQLFQGDIPVSQGTGFYFVRNIDGKEIVFLVTNYHVLTGSAPHEKKKPIGNNVVFQMHLDRSDPSKVKTIRHSLYSNTGKPLWVTSSEFPDADVAIIPLAHEYWRDTHMSVLSNEWAERRIKLRPTSQVTLVGYPYGYYDSVNCLPVYKTGNIASEPNVDFGKKPLFLVDVSAFPGMSGCPVYAISYGMYETEEGTTVGGARQFLGIYASMQMLEEKKFLEQLPHGNTTKTKQGIMHAESLQIGHVWKASLLIDLINGFDEVSYGKLVNS